MYAMVISDERLSNFGEIYISSSSNLLAGISKKLLNPSNTAFIFDARTGIVYRKIIRIEKEYLDVYNMKNVNLFMPLHVIRKAQKVCMERVSNFL